MKQKKPLAGIRRNIGRSDLKAWQESSETPQQKADMETSTHVPQNSYFRQLRIEVNLLETIDNAVKSAMMGGDFRYCSKSDFIREALQDYQNGMQLTILPQVGQRKSFTLRFNQEIKNFWDSLPNRVRADILDRILRTKMISIAGQTNDET